MGESDSGVMTVIDPLLSFVLCQQVSTVQRSRKVGSWRPSSRCALHRSHLRERSYAVAVSGLLMQLTNRIEEPPHRWPETSHRRQAATVKVCSAAAYKTGEHGDMCSASN